MFKAVGIGARNLEDGTIEVVASIQRNNVELARATFTGADVASVTADIEAELTRRQDAEEDAELSVLIVGVVLAQVGDP